MLSEVIEMSYSPSPTSYFQQEKLKMHSGVITFWPGLGDISNISDIFEYQLMSRMADDHIVISSCSLRILVFISELKAGAFTCRRLALPLPHSHRLPKLINHPTELTSVVNGGRSQNRGANRRISSGKKITAGRSYGGCSVSGGQMWNKQLSAN